MKGVTPIIHRHFTRLLVAVYSAPREQKSGFLFGEDMNVEPITSKEAKPWIVHRHYAKKMPCVQYAYGLFENKQLKGVVTYGQPPNPQPRKCCGSEYAHLVLELNRLCVDCDKKNASSILVGRSLRLLPSPSIVVSYADPNQGHVGYIYQATNWVFTGEGGGAVELYLNGVRLNERTLDHKGIHTKEDKKNYVLNRGGNWHDAKPKNRYHYFIGNKKEKKEMLSSLRYEILPYPKGETKRYDASCQIDTQDLLF
jgi:hypothetical protein